MSSVMRHAATLIVRRTAWLALIVGSFALMQAIVPASITWAPPTDAAPAEPSRADILVERHNCWQGDAPHDVDVPGHVVWQHPDGRAVYSARLVGPALDTLFADGNLAGRAIAFCR